MYIILSGKRLLMRALIDLPEDELNLLTELGNRQGTSRAAVIREAVHAYLAARRIPAEAVAFGLWGTGPGAQTEDGLSYQERMRAEW